MVGTYSTHPVPKKKILNAKAYNEEEGTKNDMDRQCQA